MYDLLLDYIREYGYIALFLALWLGIVGMPVSDEVIVMTGGALTALCIRTVHRISSWQLSGSACS